jgi:hypothetical protein
VPECLEARRPKHKMQMFFSEVTFEYSVCFCEGPRAIGKHHRYKSSDKIFEILRAANASPADHHNVTEMIRQRRPGSVELHLSEEPYNRLKFGGK